MAVPVLLAVVMIEGVQPSPAWLLLPVVWVVQAIFTLACAVLIAALGVLIRDVQHLLGVGMLLWFYLTPIFYDLDNISPNQVGWLMLNPMTVFVEAHRALTLYGRMPDWGMLGIQLLLGSLFLGISLAIFRILEDAFVEEV
jgi:lipopolysaccharide transport system permease protein